MIKVLGTGSMGNSYLIKAKNKSLLIECGLTFKQIIKGLDFDIKGVVGCLLTHSHL